MALKVGLVGLGGIGNTHAEAYKTDPLGDLVAVCDVVKARADAMAEKFGVHAYYSLKEMLLHEELDIVDVTTSGYEQGSWHYEPAIEAIEAGKHVLVEKPISHDILEARDLVKKAAQQNVYLGCNLNHYFTPTAEKAMEYMDGGHIGELVYCVHKMGFNGGEPQNYTAPKDFRWKGLPYSHLKAFLSHPFSVMRHFCGDVTHIQAFANRPGYRRRVGDVMLSTVSIHVRFANDCVGYLLSQRGDSPWGLGGWWSVEVSGTHGCFCIENCIEKVTFWPAPGSEKAGSPENMSGGSTGGVEILDTGIKDFGATFPRRIHAFLEDITNGVPKESLRASGRDALAALEYTWAVMESYELGGSLVRPNPLPALHGDPKTILG